MGLVERIILARRFQEARAAVLRAEKESDVPQETADFYGAVVERRMADDGLLPPVKD